MLIHQELGPVHQLKIIQQLMNNIRNSIGSFFLMIIKYYKQA